jgi:hypothetical protein
MSGPPIDPALAELAGACMAAARGERLAIGHDLRPLASRHRVEGLLAYATGDKRATERALAAGLGQLGACGEIAAALAGLDVLFLKGLAVSAQGYAHPLLKTSADIDILVPKNALEEAAARLSSLGFRRVVPRVGVSLGAWHAVSNQSIWQRGTAVVELHHRPLPFPLLQALAAPSRPRGRVEIGGVALDTFAPLDTFAYLSAHGALSGWFRLKWLVDVGAILGKADFTAEDAIEHAAGLGLGDAALAALVLSDRLLGLPIPAELRRDAFRRFRVRRLVTLATGLLRRGEPTARFLGTAPIHESALWVAGRHAVARLPKLIAQRRLR